MVGIPVVGAAAALLALVASVLPERETPLSGPAPAPNAPLVLFEGFEEGWAARWTEKQLAPRATRYKVVQEDGNHVLQAESDMAASGLWRIIEPPAAPGVLSWRWKVDPSRSRGHRERTKAGDDYPARVFAVFKPRLLPWKVRTLCYVWATGQPTGSIYRSPYAGSVRTLVLQSGNERAGRWVRETRDLAADHRLAFEGEPEAVSAVALMVDTDDTGGTARAWFDDLALRR